MSTNKTDVVGEYLHEVEMRVSGLPLLQRRELLADLESHIAAARDEGARTEGELIEVLERLGSPEVVAAAAYEENGPARNQPPPRPVGLPTYRPGPIRPRTIRWIIAGVVAFVLLFLVGVLFLLTWARVDSGEVRPERMPAIQPAE